MVNLTDLPVELIEGIMDAAHPMPHGKMDSRHAEQRPAASTFGAMRLVCREMNDKVFKRYVETLFSVHTVMLEKVSLRALIDMGENEYFRNALGTLFIDTSEIVYESPASAPQVYRECSQDSEDIMDIMDMQEIFQQVLSKFPNLRELTIEHITVVNNHSGLPQVACLGARAIHQRLGRRASVGNSGRGIEQSFREIFMGLATMKKELIDLQIRLVCRKHARFRAEHILWGFFERRMYEANLTTNFLHRLMHGSVYEGLDATLRGLTTLALPIKGLYSDEFEDIDGPAEADFDPKILANFLSLSPKLEDLTVFFATGCEQALIDIKTAIPWARLPSLWALELGGSQFEYKALTAGLSSLKDSLRNLTLRYVKLDSKTEWISLIRYLHTEMSLSDFEIWEPTSAEEVPYRSGLCFRNLKGKCYQPFRAWRVKKQLPGNLDAYFADLEETKMHRVGDPGCQFCS